MLGVFKTPTWKNKQAYKDCILPQTQMKLRYYYPNTNKGQDLGVVGSKRPLTIEHKPAKRLILPMGKLVHAEPMGLVPG